MVRHILKLWNSDMSATQASKRLMDSKMCMGYSNHMPFIILILDILRQ